MAFESLYDNFIAEYYDLSPIVTGRKDVDFYVSAAKEFGEPVLELGCGSGRVTLAVGQGGFRITGLDLCKQCWRKRKEKSPNYPKRCVLVLRWCRET
jgi:ubiquinone/menaquinone biosynthesis C-methylase UbiE